MEISNYLQIKKKLPLNVNLLAVSKGFSIQEIKIINNEGQNDFGESRFQEAIEKKLLLKDFEKNDTKTYIIVAYALGKSQRVIKLLRDAGYDETIYLHGSQLKICDYYISQGINLGNLEPVSYKKSEDFEGKIVIAPPSALKDKWSRRFSDPVICYASGWMSIKQRAKQSLVEIPLIISDHCDWNELITTIKRCKTKSVWVTHGREDALVHWCKSNNINAEPLYMHGREEE